MTPSAADYGWAEGDPRLDAFCLSAVAGVAVEQVLEAFSVRPETEAAASFAGAFNEFPSPTYVVVDETPAGGVVVVENNGWRGTDETVLANASRGGRVASYYRSVNADMRFVLAVDGDIRAVFDPLLDPVPAELSDAASGLGFAVESVEACSLALVERLTGIRLERDWLDEPHRRFEVPSPI